MCCCIHASCSGICCSGGIHPCLPISLAFHGRWRSYFTSGSSAAYLFLYSAFYFYTKLDITKWVPMVMYFGYMAIVSISFFCLTGATSSLPAV